MKRFDREVGKRRMVQSQTMSFLGNLAMPPTPLQPDSGGIWQSRDDGVPAGAQIREVPSAGPNPSWSRRTS
jgi:hypothetical protein